MLPKQLAAHNSQRISTNAARNSPYKTGVKPHYQQVIDQGERGGPDLSCNSQPTSDYCCWRSRPLQPSAEAGSWRTAPGKGTQLAAAEPAKRKVSLVVHAGSASFADGVGTAQFSARSNDGDADVPIVVVPQPVRSKWAAWIAESRRLRAQLRAYGVAGLLSYGALNTIYYSSAFLVIWIYFARMPRGQGWSEVFQHFATVMSLTWAASQVTKVPRAALALVVAPIADGVLIFLQARLRLRTRFNAFLLVVGLCLSLSAAIFGITLAVWA